MELTKEAQEVLAVLREVNESPETLNMLEKDDDGVLWLPMDNIVNGHIDASFEYIELMNKLSLIINGTLISSKGFHSIVFYELKNAGYGLRSGEVDSFGPLTGVIKSPDANWYVCYG